MAQSDVAAERVLGRRTRALGHRHGVDGCHKVLQRESRTFPCAVVLALTCSLKRLVLSLQLLTVLPNLALKQADISGEGREGPFCLQCIRLLEKGGDRHSGCGR